MILLKRSNEAALLPADELLPEHLAPLGNEVHIRAVLSELYPSIIWRGQYGTWNGNEFKVDEQDLTMLAIRIVGGTSDWDWLHALENAFDGRVYDVMTGDWFDDSTQGEYQAYLKEILDQE